MKDNQIRQKYIWKLQDEKIVSLIALWIFGLCIVLLIFLSILSIIKEGFKIEWVGGLIMLVGLWWMFGWEKYKYAKKELNRLRKKLGYDR